MSKALADMLGKPEVEVAEFIEHMEDKFCYPSHDVRLLAEVNQAVKNRVAGLGLDPSDTTAGELYHSLRAKFAADAAQIDKALGIGPTSGYEDRLERAIELAKHVIGNAEVWALKPTVAKSLLLELPPKKLMKQLHYRSVASILKHEDTGELYLLASLVESSTWQSALAKTIAHLASSDYALNEVNFVRPEATRLKSIAEPPELNICNKLTGAVTVWPARSIMSAPLIILALMLLQSSRRLGINIDRKMLAAVHPTLQWWANMDYLISPQVGGSISLNMNDVAHNHLNSLGYEDGVISHGAKALWTELSDRYQSLASEAEQAAESSVEKLMPAVLAAEYQEA